MITLYNNDAQELFRSLVAVLKRNKSSLEDCVRIWVYIKDIAYYDELVEGRKKIFVENNLNDNTHYIASTGIQCDSMHSSKRFKLIAHYIPNINKDTITYLHAFDRLCDAKYYGVTFERATRIEYKDRYEYFVSGTASIGSKGETLYKDDLSKQLEKTIYNIQGLLEDGKSGLKDIFEVRAYIKNIDNTIFVKDKLKEMLAIDTKIYIMRADLCRKELMIEIEAKAVKYK